MSEAHREQLKVARERAVLVAVQLPHARSGSSVTLESRLKELRALADTAGATSVGELSQKLRIPNGKTFLGRGKVEELASLVKMVKAAIVIFDHDLSPAQIRNLEQACEVKIVDRSELILDIFARRATTHAARLQVEIAQLEYTYPRLRAMWDHLGQVTGGAPVGIGTRGPGEQQLEIDRRLVQRRRKQLKRELDQIHDRTARQVEKRNADHHTVGLVGYTNAGKSSIFNAVTQGGAFANDQLFATLSTRVERWPLGDGAEVLVSDTVGFIRDLPHHLVASFRSTLEETVHGDLLLVVVDVSEAGAQERLRTVLQTLDEIGATSQRRQLVLNKVDLLPRPDELLQWLHRHPDAIPVSAATGEGLDTLAQAVAESVFGPARTVEIEIPSDEAAAVAYLERRTAVLDRNWDEGSVRMQVRVNRAQAQALLAHTSRASIEGGRLVDALDTIWPQPATFGDSCRIPLHRVQAPEAGWGRTSA
ncbi:MAG: GTPase HflX [Phycisphaerales bacterium]|nr:GTPase HflX [Phycisphaerales bacterium]